MKQMLKVMLLMLAGVLVLAGCGDEETGSNNNESSQANNEEVNEDNGNNEMDDVEENNDDGEPTNEGTSTGDDQYLDIGETGVIEGTVGKFGVTIKNPEFLDSVDGEEPYNDVFVKADIVIENLGDDVVDAGSIGTSGSISLFFGEDYYDRNQTHFDEINYADGDLEPGESTEGEIIFDTMLSDEYEISFGNMFPSEVVNEVRWTISEDDIQ